MQPRHRPPPIWREGVPGEGVRPFHPHTDWSLNAGFPWRRAVTSQQWPIPMGREEVRATHSASIVTTTTVAVMLSHTHSP